MAATGNNSNSSSSSSSSGTSAAAGGPCGRCCCERPFQVRLVVLLPASTSAAVSQEAPAVLPPPLPSPTPSPAKPPPRACGGASSSQEAEAGDMSRNGKNPKLDLRLNLSGARGGSSGIAGNSRNGGGVGGVGGGSGSGNTRNNHHNNSPHHSSSSSSPTSPPSSCVSSETDQGKCSSSPEATSMVLVGCPRCLMYVMLSEDDPKCPKCKSDVLLDFLNDPKNAANTSAPKTRKK